MDREYEMMAKESAMMATACEARPTSEPQVYRELEVQAKLNAELQEAIAELSARIGAILKPQSTEVGRSMGRAVESSMCPLAERLVELNGQTHLCTTMVRDLIQRVAL